MPRFLLLYATTYAAYGVASPFFPAFLAARGFSAEQLGLTLGAATAVRLLSGPLAGRIGDTLHAVRLVLVVSTALAAASTLALWPAHGLALLVPLTLLHGAVLAPVTLLADALAITHARPTDGHGFEYGWVRAAGSAAFVLGMLVAGQAVTAFGLTVTIQLQACLLFVGILSARLVPDMARDREHAPDVPAHGGARAHLDGFLTILRIPAFRSLAAIAALLLGSHAMHDTFAVIRWTDAGLAPRVSSVLWAESVVGEVVVFFMVGPAIVTRLTPAGAIAVAAAAGVVRWTILALPPRVPLLALAEPLHGLTFALFHLAAMRLIARLAPPSLEATALATYGTLAGVASVLLTLASGSLYARAGAAGFWGMAALCVIALPLTFQLREKVVERSLALA